MALLASWFGARAARLRWIAAYGKNENTPSIAKFHYQLKKMSAAQE
jgi:hypothetical protein